MKRILTVVLALMVLAAAFAGCSAKEEKIVVGAKDYTEQDVLGNILTLLLENNTGLKVEYKHEMSSNVVFEAIKKGEIDVYVDYTGTIYGNYLGYSDMKPPEEVYDISKKEMNEQFRLTVLSPLGFNNTYTLSVRGDTAEKYGLKTYSDLAAVSQDLILGATFEVLNRNDGIPNLKLMYDMSFREEKAIDGTLRYAAIDKDEIQVTDAFSTDGMLVEYELVVLEDDKSFFPPYHAVPVIRAQTLEKHPELGDVLGRLAGTLTDDAMRELNHKVDVLKENPKNVAEGFLKQAGLIG